MKLIQKLDKGAQIIIGQDVNESYLKALSQKGDNKNDNYLRIDEIANLNLSAEFVCLTACDTA